MQNVLVGSLYQFEPEMCDLNNWVTPSVAPYWKVFGDQLKLSDDVIKTIEAEYQTRVKDCCREVFVEWKKRQTSPYTWATIIKALQSPAISRNSVALDIAKSLETRLATN